MRVLSIDTSGDHGVVAVTIDGEVRAELHARVRARHGETLLASIERALGLAEIGIAEVELIAVGLGPGSFTGVRIGVATAKGLALARGTRLVGVRTTRVIARGMQGALRVPVVDAHKGEVFVAVYEERAEDASLSARLEETHGTPEDAARAVRAAIGTESGATIGGSGLALHGARFEAALRDADRAPVRRMPRAFDVPRGALLALEAEEALALRGPDDVAALEPLYVRASDAVLPGSSPRGAAGEPAER